MKAPQTAIYSMLLELRFLVLNKRARMGLKFVRCQKKSDQIRGKVKKRAY
jgi:hypothetical protein